MMILMVKETCLLFLENSYSRNKTQKLFVIEMEATLMKKFLVAVTLSSLLFSSSSFACGCLFKRAAKISGAAAVLLELVSAGTAYWSIKKSSPSEQNNAYQVQTTAYASSAAILLFGISCAGSDGISPCFGSLAMLAAIVGMGANVWERFKYPPQTDIAHVAFTTGLLGFLAHAASAVFTAFKRSCDPGFLEEGFLNV